VPVTGDPNSDRNLRIPVQATKKDLSPNYRHEFEQKLQTVHTVPVTGDQEGLIAEQKLQTVHTVPVTGDQEGLIAELRQKLKDSEVKVHEFEQKLQTVHTVPVTGDQEGLIAELRQKLKDSEVKVHEFEQKLQTVHTVPVTGDQEGLIAELRQKLHDSEQTLKDTEVKDRQITLLQEELASLKRSVKKRSRKTSEEVKSEKPEKTEAPVSQEQQEEFIEETIELREVETQTAHAEDPELLISELKEKLEKSEQRVQSVPVGEDQEVSPTQTET
jgi:predicted amino acid-binding ACT domain protein